MTKEDAIKKLHNRYHLSGLPCEFHTKEFVLECINEHNLHISVCELHICGLLDYDIALAKLLIDDKDDGGIDLYYVFDLYGDHLTIDEISKLFTTVKML